MNVTISHASITPRTGSGGVGLMEHTNHETDRTAGHGFLRALENAASAMTMAAQQRILPKGRRLDDFRTLATQSGLSDAEIKLLSTAPTGEVCVVSDYKTSNNDDITRLKNDPTLEIRGSLVRFLLLGGDAQTPVHERGIRIAGAHITDSIDLDSTANTVPLGLFDTIVEKDIELSRAQLSTIVLRKTIAQSINAFQTAFSGSFTIANCLIHDGIFLNGAHVGGRVALENTTVKRGLSAFGASVRLDFECTKCTIGSDSITIDDTPQEISINLNSATINGSIHLSGSTFHGAIFLTGVNIGRFFMANNIQVDCPNSIALKLDGASIDGAFTASHSKIGGMFRAPLMTIKGNLNLSHTTIDPGSGPALWLAFSSLSALTLTSSTILGLINLDDVEISGALELSGATIRSSKTTLASLRSSIGSITIEPAQRPFSSTGNIIFQGCRIRSSILLDSADIIGFVDLSNSAIGGNVIVHNSNLQGASTGPENASFIAERLNVAGTMRFEGVIFNAKSHLYAVQIGSNLTYSACTLSPGKSLCLVLSNAQVQGDMMFENGCDVSGGCVLSSTRVGGTVSLISSKFSIPPDGTSVSAFLMDNSRIERDVAIRNTKMNGGRISLATSSIGGDLYLKDSHFDSPEGRETLYFSNTEISGDYIQIDCKGSSAAVGSGMACGGDIRIIGCKWDASIKLDGAKIGASLRILRSSIGNGNATNKSSEIFPIALQAEALSVGDNLLIGDSTFNGTVDLTLAKIQGSAVLRQNTLDCCGEANIGTALSMQQAVIGRTFGFSEDGTTRIKGIVDLFAAHFQNWVFCHKHIEHDGYYRLDGLTFDKISIRHSGGPQKGALYLLHKQVPNDLGTGFKPQPFEQMAKAFYDGGREPEARAILKLKSAHYRRRDRLWLVQDTKQALRAGNSATSWAIALLKAPFIAAIFALRGTGLLLVELIYGQFLGSGYAKAPPFIVFFALLFACGWIYDRGAAQGSFVPVNQSFSSDPLVRATCAGEGRSYSLTSAINWTKCANRIQGLNEFRPYWYSLDLMLQFGPLGQRRDWEPTSQAIEVDLPFYGKERLPTGSLKLIAWIQALIALGLYGLIAAMIARALKKD